MKIKTIGYGELKTGCNYDNKRLYIEAELSDTDCPNKVYKKLQAIVKNSLNEGKTAMIAVKDLIGEDEIPF